MISNAALVCAPSRVTNVFGRLFKGRNFNASFNIIPFTGSCFIKMMNLSLNEIMTRMINKSI